MAKLWRGSTRTGSKMKKNKPSNPTTRRTGLDRRWIPSANHQPERRRRRDRRTIRNRSFLEPFESKGGRRTASHFPKSISRQDSRRRRSWPCHSMKKDYPSLGKPFSKGSPQTTSDLHFGSALRFDLTQHSSFIGEQRFMRCIDGCAPVRAHPDGPQCGDCAVHVCADGVHSVGIIARNDVDAQFSGFF